MKRLVGMAIIAMTRACGFAARAEDKGYDPAKVSESLKAIFQFGSVETKRALNANTVTVMSGTIGGTYVQFGADLASVLDDGNKLRVLSIVGRGSVQSVADILFLQGSISDRASTRSIISKRFGVPSPRDVYSQIDPR